MPENAQSRRDASGSPAGKDPTVTVLLSVYNGAPYVRSAVASILNQTFADFEFLIIDDGSTDGTRVVLDTFADPRIRRLVHPTNRGLSVSLHEGLARARGRYIARQDADDISLPERLGRQVAFLEAHPDVAVVGGQARLIDATGRPIRARMLAKPLSRVGVRFKVMFDGPLIHSAVMFRRALVRDGFGGYNLAWPTYEDYELWSRLTEAGCPMANLSDVLLEHRHHAACITCTYDPLAAERVRNRMRANLQAICQCDDDFADWLDFWTAVLFAKVLPPPSRSGPALKALDRIHRRFTRLHTEPEARGEIRWHLACTLMTAFHGCVRTRPATALRCLARALRVHPAATFSIAWDSALRHLARLIPRRTASVDSIARPTTHSSEPSL